MNYFTDWGAMSNLLILLCKGMLTALSIFGLTLLFSLPLGLAVALGRMSRNPWVRKPVQLFILIMRGTPLLLQLVVVYFGPSFLAKAINPAWMDYVNIDRFVAAVVAFVLNYSAYFAEIYRGGIESISQGQVEAAQVLGMSRGQIFFQIILPQVYKRILPAMSNEVITLVKDTALVQTLGVAEIFRAAKNEATRVFSTTPLFIAGLFYLAMNGIVTQIFQTLEKKVSYYR